ncbi:hypothetical protein ATE92_1036 [Ulvibacter sp. MAR_2010_11]|uniref:hypothetical protein n=1 Tax=Ulvibacter sp. MAR_2010_11 TaxID=1250229 RepID=UPI000C2BBFA7|nr:hypothetical protein [Ulvibacter sp. MAR_2010_11]PKA82896.1 hypothetical protein ATE92_1036 [Ulvibacter sp. MAR_2010_11]
MTKDLLNFFLKLAAFTGLLLAIHYYIFFNFFSEIILYFPLWIIYTFNAVLVFAVFAFVNYKSLQGSEKIYNIFLGLTLVKMVLAIIFLLPVFAGKVESPRVEVINFFIPYFVFLAFEIFSLNKIFRNQQTK